MIKKCVSIHGDYDYAKSPIYHWQNIGLLLFKNTFMENENSFLKRIALSQDKIENSII